MIAQGGALLLHPAAEITLVGRCRHPAARWVHGNDRECPRFPSPPAARRRQVNPLGWNWIRLPRLPPLLETRGASPSSAGVVSGRAMGCFDPRGWIPMGRTRRLALQTRLTQNRSTGMVTRRFGSTPGTGQGKGHLFQGVPQMASSVKATFETPPWMRSSWSLERAWMSGVVMVKLRVKRDERVAAALCSPGPSLSRAPVRRRD